MNSPETGLKAQRPMSILFCRIFPSIGLIGLIITLALNLVALLAFKRPAAEFFSHGWWSAWFPNYVVWLVFVAMGLAGAVKVRRKN